MSPTFETVLEHANTLSDTDRKKLPTILGKSNGRTHRVKNGVKDDTLLAELRSKVDAIEKAPGSKHKDSAIEAERIRQLDDRAFSL